MIQYIIYYILQYNVILHARQYNTSDFKITVCMHMIGVKRLTFLMYSCISHSLTVNGVFF